MALLDEVLEAIRPLQRGVELKRRVLLYSYLSIRPTLGLVMFYQTSCLRVGGVCSPPEQGADLQTW
jgi:hypothetical protein